MSYKVFFLFFISFFMRINAMEIQQHFPQDLQKIIFHYVDYKSKQNLVFTCRSFLKVAEEYLKEKCSFDNFVDKLYAVPSESRVFLLLSNNCQEEHKISLINYFSFKGKQIEDEKTKDFDGNLYKNRVIKECFFSHKNENDILFALLVEKNQKKHVKYYTDYSNALFCMELLKRNFDNKHEKLFWLNGISLKRLMGLYAYIKQDIKKMFNFFMQCNLKEINNEALKSKNIFILVLLSAYMEQSAQTISDGIKKISDFFYDASTDELRKLLAKSGYALGLKGSYNKAIASRDFDRAKCYLEIMIDRGDNCNEIKIIDIINCNLGAMLPALFEAGVQISLYDLKDLSVDQIKKYVEIGYGLYGKDFWSQGANRYILQKAICSENVELVKYFLSVETNLDLIIDSGAKPILYALNNDDIFNLLIEGSSQCFNALYPHIIEMCLSYNNAEQNIIKLMQKEKDNDVVIKGWFGFAIKHQRNKIFQYLFNRLKLKDEDKTQFLKPAISKKNLDLVKFLLDNNKVSINELSLNVSDINEKDKELLDFLLAHKVNIFAISDQYEMILKLVNDQSIITCYEEHKRNIPIKQYAELLSCAIKQGRYDVVKYLLNIENTQLNFLLFKDLVTHNKNNDKALRCFLDYAIEKRSVEMVNAVLAHHKDINSLGSCIIDSWHIEDKDIMEIFINYGFNIIHLIHEKWPCAARACLNILDAETLIKSLKNGEDVITSQQALLLLKNVSYLYTNEWNPHRYKDDKKIEPLITKAKTLFSFIISLKKIDILAVLSDPAELNKLLFLELIDDQVIIDYISSKADLTDLQLQELLHGAVSSNKCNVVSYLFKEKNFSLEVVKVLWSKDENMQQILKLYQKKLEQQESAKKVQVRFDGYIKEITYTPQNKIVVDVEQVSTDVPQEKIVVDVELVDAYQERVSVDDNNQIIVDVNSVSRPEGFLFWGTIKNIVSSCFTTICSILQWLNPLRFIFG